MPADVRLIIVSGLSGSGKSVALHVLEDLGYYCIDNLPVALLKSLLSELSNIKDQPITRIAVSVDARNPHTDIDTLPKVIEALSQNQVRTDVLFLQTTDDVLLTRYSESRRRHPLAANGKELRAAIAHERQLLGRIINIADLIIDTSSSSVYELGDTIRERVDRRHSSVLSVLIESFGFKHGIPADADFVFDLRCLPNPYWQPELRSLTGLDKDVADFLDSNELFENMHTDILAFLQRWIPRYVGFDRGYLTVAIGCTGGQHRSVHMVEKLAGSLRKSHDPILTRHNELLSRARTTEQ
jgi:UPF0042 nucleotide-binding protein